MIGEFEGSSDIPKLGRKMTPIEALFYHNEGNLVHKWHHYLPVYERYLSPFRGKPVKMLEIGVSGGGSMDMWRKYLGPDAFLVGIDVDPRCAKFNGVSGQIRIGSQADEAFLFSIYEEMGRFDIVLDDGSHDSKHIRKSFEYLYPRVRDGGLYIIEDLHAAYWKDFSGGYHSKTSFMNDIKTMIDDMHHWYHDEGQKIAATKGHLSALHIYDSIVVFEKQKVPPPQHTQRGVMSLA